MHRRTILPDPIIEIDRVRIYAEGLDHPEGITWGPDGRAYAGGELGQVYRLDGRGQEPGLIGEASGGLTLGLALDRSGRIYTCDPRHQAILRFEPDGNWERYAWRPDDDPIVGCNHLAFATDGSLFFSDSGHWKADDGRLLRAGPGGGIAEIWSTDLRTVPNGVCMGPGDEFVYVAMSIGPGRIDRVRVLADGSAGPVETYATFGDAMPDGLAFASNGDLYVVTYRPDAIFVVRHGTRQVELLVEDLEGVVLASPTNLAFGIVDGAPVLLCANIGRWHIAEIPVAVGGLPLAYPDLP